MSKLTACDAKDKQFVIKKENITKWAIHDRIALTFAKQQYKCSGYLKKNWKKGSIDMHMKSYFQESRYS